MYVVHAFVNYLCFLLLVLVVVPLSVIIVGFSGVINNEKIELPGGVMHQTN